MKIFFLYRSVYSCHVFLISSASVRSILFLSFFVPIFAWNVPLLSLIFLKRSLVFPFLLFSSISFHWSLRKPFLCVLAILMNSAFRWVYLSFSPLPLASLLSSTICKPSSDNHFAFLHFFFLGMVLTPASCTMSLVCYISNNHKVSEAQNNQHLCLCVEVRHWIQTNLTVNVGWPQFSHQRNKDSSTCHAVFVWLAGIHSVKVLVAQMYTTLRPHGL